MKAKFKSKEREFEAVLVSVDNLEEIKTFCPEYTTITLEYAGGIGCFWNIQLHDALLNKTVTVPYGSYILKTKDGLCFSLATTEIATAFGLTQD